ncbi:MAG: universal stress protein [Acidimicrobiia bacterium]|nr:universal stress protein [Acidimicrobiia bacterium]
MSEFKNVLVVTAEDAITTRSLIEAAASLSHGSSGAITLFSVFDNARRPTRRPAVPPLGRVRAADRVFDLGPNIGHLGLPIHHEVGRGIPHLEVLERISLYGHDLVVVAGGARAAMPGFSRRSIVTHLLRRSPVPVLVHPREAISTSGTVAVAVGPEWAEDNDVLLNSSLLDTAASLARSRDSRLHVIHAWRLAGESMMRGQRLAYDATDIEQMASLALRSAQSEVDDALASADLAGVQTRVRVEKGHAQDVITAELDRVRPDVLVMGTMARRGVSGVIVGNTAERVVSRATSPVLVLKPEGSSTPHRMLEEWSPALLPY